MDKLYYVVGKNFMGGVETVKTYALSPAGARDNAGWKLATVTRVHLAANITKAKSFKS